MKKIAILLVLLLCACSAPIGKPTTTIGVVSDIHGEVQRSIQVAQIFKDHSVDMILVPGDVANNEELRSEEVDKVPDEQEIFLSLEALAQTNIPVLAIPGNHERKGDWHSAIQSIHSQHENVLDMSDQRIMNGDGVDVVSLPGYQVRASGNQQFIPDDGFYASPQMIRETGQLAKGLDDPIFLLVHGAGRTGSPGPATIYSGEDVGDDTTTQMMRDSAIRFAVVGNIHEAAGLATTLDGDPIPEGEFVDEFVLNVGTLQSWPLIDGRYINGTAAIITVQGNQAKFDMIYLE